ncbi:MAG: hypothetical protein IJD33_02390, partial [Clostridia bacterium]|nr:hypothetical protein [Clostridia bacterium]
MKRNNVAKRFGIAGLCLATAVSAIGGFSLLNKNWAIAEDLTSIAPVSLVTASENATVTYEDGVRVSSDTKYSGEINYTFTENASFVVRFPETTDGNWWYGNFVYRISDATNENNYFDIVYDVNTTPWISGGKVKNYTDISVQYNGLYRSSSYGGTGEVSGNWYTAKKGDGTTTFAFFEDYDNEMKLVWDNDVLRILVSRAGNQSIYDRGPRVIAAFDGTEEFVSGTSWGLPKINFDNGYKVSFFSEFSTTFKAGDNKGKEVEDHASDVRFTSIKSYTSSWSKEYNLAANALANAEEVTIADRGAAYQGVEVGDELTIPTANVAASVKVIQPDGTTANVTAGGKYTVSQKGLHTVQYTTEAGSVAAFSFKAKEMIAAKDFIYTSASVSQDSNGLRISSDESYNATLKGVFKGDTTLKFRFPETYTDWYAGDFVVRVTDATNESNYFDVKYAPSDAAYHYTGAHVYYGNETRTSNTSTSWANTKKGGWYPLVLPTFRSSYNKAENTEEGSLAFTWTNDVLSVQVSGVTGNVRTIAAFDGTYDTSKENNGFVSGTSWGLPKLNFANGYVISVSSSFTNANTTDKATDVLFTSVQNGATVYDLKADKVEKDNNREAFDNAFAALGMVEVKAGEVFLGWKNTVTGELYPAYSFFKKQAGENYEAVVISFDTIDGASVRLDTSENGQSGIRFITAFDYEAVQGYVQSFGTLIAYTDTLNEVGKEFTIENYEGVDTFAKVANQKGTFEYTDKDGVKYEVYSMALVDIKNYSKSYSARGYLVVEYADGSTQTIYSDFDATNNSRSIQQVAQILKATDEAEYNAMSDAQKAIIDAYEAGNAQ